MFRERERESVRLILFIKEWSSDIPCTVSQEEYGVCNYFFGVSCLVLVNANSPHYVYPATTLI